MFKVFQLKVKKNQIVNEHYYGDGGKCQPDGTPLEDQNTKEAVEIFEGTEGPEHP